MRAAPNLSNSRKKSNRVTEREVLHSKCVIAKSDLADVALLLEEAQNGGPLRGAASMTTNQRGEPTPDGKTPFNRGLLDALMEIGKKRATILEAMKEALLRGDEDEALERARELAGLPTKRSTK